MNSIKKMLSDAVLPEKAELLAEFPRAVGSRLSVIREELDACESSNDGSIRHARFEQAVSPLKEERRGAEILLSR